MSDQESVNKSKLIYEKISAINKAIGAILKTGKNIKQGWNFRGIDQVYNTLHPLLAEYDIFTTSKIIDEHIEFKQSSKGTLIIFRFAKIKYFFHTVDGSSISTEVLAEAMDYGDKASGKLMSYAHKYAFFQIFTIPTQELEDPDRDSYDDDDIEPDPNKNFHNDNKQKNNIESERRKLKLLGQKMINIMVLKIFTDEERTEFGKWLNENKTIQSRQKRLEELEAEKEKRVDAKFNELEKKLDRELDESGKKIEESDDIY